MKSETAVATRTKDVKLIADYGDVYIRVRNGKILRPIKVRMALFERAGHFYEIKKKFAITSSGYFHLNKAAAINIVTPQKVVLGDREVFNPHIERNEKTRAIESVSVRKIGIGFAPTGNLVVLDKTLHYNCHTYLLQSFQAKMKKVRYDEKYKDCGIIGPKKETPKQDGKWAWYEIATPLGIWVNYGHFAMIEALEEHVQRTKFGERIAQTIVERNILKDHPAIAITEIDPKGNKPERKAYVVIYGFRHDMEPPDIDRILEQAEQGDKVIETKADVIDVEPEEEKQAIEEVVEEKIEEKKEDEIEEKKEETEAKDEEKKTPGEMEEPPDGFYDKKRESGEEG